MTVAMPTLQCLKEPFKASPAIRLTNQRRQQLWDHAQQEVVRLLFCGSLVVFGTLWHFSNLINKHVGDEAVEVKHHLWLVEQPIDTLFESFVNGATKSYAGKCNQRPAHPLKHPAESKQLGHEPIRWFCNGIKLVDMIIGSYIILLWSLICLPGVD
eukprot:TRINITY_DN10202_c0_g2_i1.p3 TRINITY_DN10202_c0_g2~~TRINITY_DN10202_c0_g2_i1.p3  ORF type:complete len:156 (+),score=20.34 TRINITY_DN10202_c0_g2_i1:2663-3130(+)